MAEQLLLTHEESAAIRRVLTIVAAEADRIENTDSEAWAQHAGTIDSLIVDFEHGDGMLDALDHTEAGAVRFLISDLEWESSMDSCERAALARLRAKLLS